MTNDFACVTPEGYTLERDGTTHAHGARALDGWLFWRGRELVLSDPAAAEETVVAAEPPEWRGTHAEWALDQLGLDDDYLPTMTAYEEVRPSAPSMYELAGFDVGNPALAALFHELNLYLVLHDIDYILAVLAAATARDLTEYDPLWLMLVAPSSSGKGEALRLLGEGGDGHPADARMNDVSLPGLLHNKKKTGEGFAKGGVLADLEARQLSNALVVIPDFSALLGDTGKSGDNKSLVFNALRDIYDGAFRRDIAPAPVAWQGRVSFVAACTPAIDRFTAHADALGTRWLYYRVPERSVEHRKEIVQMVTGRERLAQRRAAAQISAREIIAAARDRVHEVSLPPGFDAALGDLAVLACYGRASVPRDWRREIDDIPTTEDPGRMVGQLRMLALGLVALGVRDDVALRVTRHAALSSMPQSRSLAIQAVAASDEPLTAHAVAKRTGMHRAVADRALEDWQAVGVLRTEQRQQTNEAGAPTAPVGDVFLVADDYERYVRVCTP